MTGKEIAILSPIWFPLFFIVTFLLFIVAIIYCIFHPNKKFDTIGKD